MGSELDAMRLAWAEWEKEGYVSCLETGKQLRFAPIHCAHIISKGARGDMRLDIENMMPLSAEAHIQYDQGNKTEMMIWPWVQKRIQYLREKYR